MTKNSIILFLLTISCNAISLSMENGVLTNYHTDIFEENSCCCYNCDCDHTDVGFAVFCTAGLTLRSIFPNEIVIPYAIAACIGAGTSYTLNKKMQNKKDITAKFE